MSIPQHQAPRGRHIGVGTAQSQAGTREERATNKRNALISFSPAQMFAIEYTDEQGIKQDPVVIFEAGGVFYMPPNAAQWSKELRPLADWLQAEMRRRLEAAKGFTQEVPSSDPVEIIGEE